MKEKMLRLTLKNGVTNTMTPTRAATATTCLLTVQSAFKNFLAQVFDCFPLKYLPALRRPARVGRAFQNTRDFLDNTLAIFKILVQKLYSES